MNKLRISMAVMLAALAQHVAAQDAVPPRGPADIIRSASKPRTVPDKGLIAEPGAPQPSAAEDKPAAALEGMPAGHPDVAPQRPDVAPAPAGEAPLGQAPVRAQTGGDNEQVPVGDDPHAGMEGAPPLARRPMATAEPSASVPAGSVRVRVLDADDHPVPDATLQLGTMTAQSGRSATPGKTGPDGTFTFTDQPTGDKQAYRVNVLHQGAKYSSMPFRLPPDRGYDVMIRRLDTTTDTKNVVLYVGATSLELKDDRIKIVQQARIVNIGGKTYVFPQDGLLVKLPSDLLVFQAEDVMTDQHMREDKGKGMRITGSIPPGEVTLTWGFDVPQTDSEANYTFDLPWVTFAYRVLADAAPGMQLEVDGMPPAELHADNGRRFLVTEIVKRVGEPPLRKVQIHLKNIPGQGPLRYVAVGLALLLVIGGVLLVRASEGSRRAAPLAAIATRDLEQEKARLLERARTLDHDRERGEIGPEFHHEALQDLEEQLAAVLFEEARVAGAKPSQRAKAT
jgi:hypothetical protein